MEFSILPKWFTESNFPFGADDDEGSGKGTGDGSSNGESNNQGNQGNSGDGSKKADDGKEQDDSADDPYAGLSAKELKRLLADETTKANTVAAERDSLKTKVDESEREKLDEKGKLELDNTNLKDANASLKSTNAKLAIINAILMDDTYQWHNPEMVAAQLNSEIVKVSDDGKVEGLKNELKRIAKDNDWMLKKQGQQQNNGNGSTGFQPGQGGSNNGGNQGKPEAAELAKIMPALASRVNR